MTDSATGFQYTPSQSEYCKSMFLSKRFATMTRKHTGLNSRNEFKK